MEIARQVPDALLLSIAERVYTFVVIKPRQRRLLDAQIAQITGD